MSRDEEEEETDTFRITFNNLTTEQKMSCIFKMIVKMKIRITKYAQCL
jgi:hypothetical protein